MKDKLFAVFTGLVIGLVIAGIMYGVFLFFRGLKESIAAIDLPSCAKYEQQYYWKSFSGNMQYVGTDLAKAREMAGDKPLGQANRCIEWN